VIQGQPPPERIREFRKLKGMSITELAGKVGCSTQLMTTIEDYVIDLPISSCRKIAQALGKTLDEVFGQPVFPSDRIPLDEWGRRSQASRSRSEAIIS
jgi:transcriptional regulator with XRE-family HTH domain